MAEYLFARVEDVDVATALQAVMDAQAAATAADASADAAALSETAAIAAQAAAEAAQAAAEAAADNFDDVYLGSKAADPTLDNDGNPLVEGQLYWNSVSNQLMVYDGAAWSGYAAQDGITALIEDTTPQLGGDLDLNGFDITGNGNLLFTGNIDMTGDMDITGDVAIIGSMSIGGGDVAHTIAGATVTSQIELHSDGVADLGGLTIHRHTDANDFGGHIIFLRSDGSHAAPAVPDDGDSIARMVGGMFDGTDYETGQEIRYVVDGTPGNNNAPGAIDFYTNAGSQTLVRRMRIRADGTVMAGPLVPLTDDGAALGTTALKWSDVFLASGAVVNFNNGDATLTHSANLLAFAGATSGYSFGGGPVVPGTTNTEALGTTALMWADLFLGSGSVINWDNGDLTLTHAANLLTLAGGALLVPTLEVENVDTTLSRFSAGVIAVEGVAVYATSPVQSFSADRPIVLADAHTTLLHPSSDNNARTVTIPDNGTIPFPLGTMIIVHNKSATAINIAITSDTLTWAGMGTTGTRALAQHGVVTMQKIASTEWVISGVGLT